jgi:hypothetical protein
MVLNGSFPFFVKPVNIYGELFSQQFCKTQGASDIHEWTKVRGLCTCEAAMCQRENTGDVEHGIDLSSTTHGRRR